MLDTVQLTLTQLRQPHIRMLECYMQHVHSAVVIALNFKTIYDDWQFDTTGAIQINFERRQ